jgi:hypothetical protein
LMKRRSTIMAMMMRNPTSAAGIAMLELEASLADVSGGP